MFVIGENEEGAYIKYIDKNKQEQIIYSGKHYLNYKKNIYIHQLESKKYIGLKEYSIFLLNYYEYSRVI